VKAPISGTIVEQNVTAGTGVRSLDNSPNLFTIADMSHVWVLCDVYEDMLNRVTLGDIAEIRLNAYPDRVHQGRVSNISRVLDPSTRTAKVRIELDNPHRIMRAGMFVTASFRSRQQQQRLVIPTSAILRLHDKDWVFRPLGGNRFRRVEVRTGLTLPDGKQEVLSDLQLGDKIISNALQFSSASEMQQ
jgi:cobalt-zinc-cadmium efflux system membrane fusion protein